ncbi:ABC transporter permease [Staphylococcus americanisciuri]|uniref:FtsX-like permease family protein n=1 Tax=Staphylococcus americanisciuri TaxID=2973940 RepID=A0ABT2F280_9STAP|nr:FtsX-like permease family protein [Staphylococcus americanisciuri]MCS4486253.1 FtsX-like permease family protein [Staphylococcus americanisciuri]
MKYKKLTMDAFKLLLRNKRQSILTSLAIAIATFVVLIVLSSSFYTTSSLNDDLQVDEAVMTLTYTPENMLDVAGFTNSDKELVERELGQHVTLKSSSYGLYTAVYYKNAKQNLSFRTIQDLKDNNIELPSLLKGKHLEKVSNGIAISDKALSSLTRQTDVEKYLGSELIILGKTYKICSIYYGSEVNEMLPSLIVSDKTKNRLLNGKSYYDEMILPTNHLKDVNKALAVLDAKGTYRENGSYGFNDKKRLYNETEDQATTILNFIAVLSSISIFVAGFGVMNAMLSSVSERSKEIAIRRALGAKKADIHFAYMMEGTILSTIGGMIGSFSAICLVVLMNMTGLVAKLSVGQVLITLGATIIFGIVFSIIPAMVAANKNVVDGLR